VTKQNMRFAQFKTQEQLHWQSMHRVRDRLMRRRSVLINEIRGFLLERGITFAAQPIHLRKNLPIVIEDAEQNLSPRLRWLLDCMWHQWKQTETEIQQITDEIERISNEDARCRQLRQIHGARSVLFRVKYDTGGFGQWVRRLAQCAPHNKVVVAIANKLAHRLGRGVQRPRLSTSAAAATGGCLMAVEKTLRFESTKRFPLFPPPRRRMLDRVLPRSAEERRRREEQPNGVPENLMVKMRP
jgi:hypothetical protein